MTRPPVAVTLSLTAIVSVALILRLAGLQFGLPAVYNPDEVAIMARALSFAKGTLNPHNFLYPTFYFYVLFGWVGLYLGFVWITGGVASVSALQELYFTDPTGIYTAGRTLSAVCGTLSVVAVFALGRRLADARAGLAAAAFLAVAPLAVRDAHYVKHDVPATLAVLVACLAIARIWPLETSAPPPRTLLLAAAACGVAFSTHYYCVFLACPLTLAIVMRWWPEGWRAVAQRLVGAALVSAAVFFALSPFILVEPAVAWQDVVANRQIVVDRAVSGGAFASAARYLDILWNDSMGVPVILFAVVGLVVMFATNRWRALFLVAFPLPFLAFIANTAPASRYLNPVLPFVAIFAATGVLWIADVLRAPARIVQALVLVTLSAPLLASIDADRFFREADTRTQARGFIETTIRPGTTILVQPYSVPLTPSRESLVEALTTHLGNADAASTKFQIQLALDPYPAPAYRLLWLGRGGLDVDKIYVDPSELGGTRGLARLREMSVSYVILKRPLEQGSELEPLAASLEAEAQLVSTFSPYKIGRESAVEPFLHNSDARLDAALARPGPVVQIWRISDRK